MQELLFQLGLHTERVGVEVFGQVGVVPWIPFGVIDAIQDSDERTAPGAQGILQAHAVLVGADLARMGRADCRNRIGVEDALPQRVDASRAQVVLVQHVVLRPEREVLDER